MRSFVCALILLSTAATLSGQTQQPDAPRHSLNFFVTERARALGWQWYEARPYNNAYGYGESMLRFGMSQSLMRWDWRLEITQATIIDAPSKAVSPVSAQGQLGFGGAY